MDYLNSTKKLFHVVVVLGMAAGCSNSTSTTPEDGGPQEHDSSVATGTDSSVSTGSDSSVSTGTDSSIGDVDSAVASEDAGALDAAIDAALSDSSLAADAVSGWALNC